MREPGQAVGKFLLGGEHSVLFKGRALSFPLPQLRLYYHEDEETLAPGLHLNGERRSHEHFEQLAALRAALFPARPTARNLVIQTDIPLGGGLGSSAALCTALCRYNDDQNLNPVALATKALEGERFFHGISSGVDPFTVSFERPLVFRSEGLNACELDTRFFAEADLVFALFDSGLRHRTDDVVRGVSLVKEKTPLIWEDLMDALATNVEMMLKAIEGREATTLGRLMNDTHFRLIQLGVSNDVLDDLVEKLRRQGALGAKLTGAGRGGFVLGLFQEKDLERLSPTERPLIWRATTV